MGINKKIKGFSIMIGIVIVLSVIGSVNFNYDSYIYKRNFDKKYEFNLNSANSGNWLPEITKSVGSSPHDVFVGDANNDGYNDIVTANSLSVDALSIILWNANSGDWDPQITRSAGGSGESVSIGDANNDGYNDIVVLNFGSGTASILLWNTISSDWDTPITKPVGSSPTWIVIADANNDGYNDIATANEGPDTVSILLWNTISVDWDSYITRPVGSGSDKLFIGDANNDGYNDIAVSNFYDNNVSILLWNAISGDWDSQITREVGLNPRGVFIGDANNDGDNDIAIANNGDNTVSILLWNSTSGDWDSQITSSVKTGPSDVFIEDANNDGYNDIATPNTGGKTVSLLLWNITSGDWDPQITRSVGTNPRAIFIGDADTDGDNDIVTANVANNTVSILQWDTIAEIVINSPNDNQLFGNTAPSFNLTIVDDNLDTSWYSIDGGLTNYTFVGTTGIINQGAWNAQPNGTVIIWFYINDTTGSVEFDEVTVRKDLTYNPVPVITIISPTAQTFGIVAPNYSVNIVGNNLDTFWYSIDGGLTNYSFVETSGTINQGAWDMRPNGNVLIAFYANSSTGIIGFNELMVRKYVEQPEETIPGYNVVVIIGIICIVSVIFNNLRHKYNQN